jgi:hypothetical protein
MLTPSSPSLPFRRECKARAEAPEQLAAMCRHEYQINHPSSPYIARTRRNETV